MTLNIICFAAGFLVAFILFFSASYANWKRKRKRKKSGSKKKVKIDTYVKAATTVVIVHGLTMITLSYVLAWFGKEAVAEVSTTLITEVVAPLCLYMGTNCIMNIFEKNELSFSKPIQLLKMQEANEKVFNEIEEITDDCTDENAVG